MARHDLEQANEQTKLLGHATGDRGFGALVNEDDVVSVINSFVSRGEQALSAAPVGERLPYNDYTTIDWLHDLVDNSTTTYRNPMLTIYRSKTPIAVVPSIGKPGSVISLLQSRIRALAGSPLP